MNYNLLGNTGVKVSELCLGTMTIGGTGYWEAIGTLGSDEAAQLFKTFFDAGGNFIDSANAYGFGESEKRAGQALASLGIPRQDYILATKALLRMGPGPNNVGLSRLHLAQSIDDSLKRLQTDYIDLFQIHGYDPLTALDETLRGLEDAVRAGKVRYIGACNMPAWMLAEANGIAAKNGWTKFISTQNYYSAAGRDLEFDILPYAKYANLAVLPWSPLAGGLLSGKFTEPNQQVEGSRRSNFNFPPVADNAFDIVIVMSEIAKELDATVPQVALAWMLNQPGITSIIMGAKNTTQLTDNLGAVALKSVITEDQLARIDAVSKPQAIYPYWMMSRQSDWR